MAKKKTKPIKTIKKQEPKHTLIELIQNCPENDLWIMYNLSRTGLLQQYEQEIQDYGIKEIQPTLTIEEFEKIIKGEQ